jgi:hypothetical protein
MDAASFFETHFAGRATAAAVAIRIHSPDQTNMILTQDRMYAGRSTETVLFLALVKVIARAASCGVTI